MAVRLFTHPDHPNRIGISEMDSFVTDGVFFLDFSRPLEPRRWFGVRNRYIGFLIALFVPIVHQGQYDGGYIVCVFSSEPYFRDIRALWKKRYPEKKIAPATPADGLKIIADFARQFPESCP